MVCLIPTIYWKRYCNTFVLKELINAFIFLHFLLLSGRFGRLIITTKDGDRNLLRSKVFKELRILDNMIRNAVIKYDDEYFTYHDVCAKSDGDCFYNDILELEEHMDAVSY